MLYLTEPECAVVVVSWQVVALTLGSMAIIAVIFWIRGR